MANFEFDATQVDPASSFDPIPAGTYAVRITESERKQNSKKNGEYIKLTFTVVEGQYKGRLLWVYLNVIHSNATTQEIGRKELSAICHATNQLKLRDTKQLHDITIEVVVRVVEDDQYGKSNDITGYKKRERTIVKPKPKAKVKPKPEPETEEEYEEEADEEEYEEEYEDEEAPWDN